MSTMGMFQHWAFKTVRVHRRNEKGSLPLTHVFDMILRPDSQEALLIETWGGFSKGYAKLFATGEAALVHLGKRLNKIVRPADATIGLGDLKNGETRILLDEGIIDVVHNEDWTQDLEELKDSILSKRVDKHTIKGHANVLGYTGSGWDVNGNISSILYQSTNTKVNNLLAEVLQAMVCRIGLDAGTDYSRINESTVDICQFIKPFDMTLETPKLYEGDFVKAFIMSANMIRKNKPIYEEPVPEGTETVLTEEELEVVNAEHYKGWGAWS